MADKEFHDPIENKYDMPWLSKRLKLAELVQKKYDAFLATQLTLIAKEKGVSVTDLCLRHNDIFAHIQNIYGDIKFWVEIK